MSQAATPMNHHERELHATQLVCTHFLNSESAGGDDLGPFLVVNLGPLISMELINQFMK